MYVEDCETFRVPLLGKKNWTEFES